ncbi:transcription elongation factor spt5 [Neocucurbitaria cava]|uniref:Transcription elongation factor spt5 n=1 Tax=Neocucurbitaria cava TaxID=798079 RepID=A0A9W9CNZ3_9PLEO|nr:transcription elongation factor spt5 [Neocucurbitaria cava]
MKAIQITKFVTVSFSTPLLRTKLTRTIQNLKDLTPRDVPDPKHKGPHDVHIKITHAAVTHVDLLYAQGLHQNNKRHVKPPFILGNEFSGIVVSAPPHSSFKPGDKVWGGGLGSYAEQICVPEESLHHVPAQWTNAEACAVGSSGAVSYGALISVARLKAGETALILGASGGLGVMAVQIAKAVGAKVIAVVGDDEKAQMIREIGADAVRFGEDGRKDPQRTKDVWDGFMKLVETGKIRPVVYKEEYWGLEAVPRALEDARRHKSWGRAILRINEDAERETGTKPKL